jgi:predicted nucleic acid-binding protein
MLFVVDTNILFSFFWQNSPTKELLIKNQLVSPEISLKEINRYKSLILSKTKLSSEEFLKLKRELALLVDFIPEKEYSEFFKQAERLSKSFSEKEIQEFFNDLDFFALAFKLDIPIWSNDKLFKKQSSIKVFNTREVLEFTQAEE